MIAIIIIAVLVVLLILVFVGVNNSMIGARNRCDEAWSGIDVQLKRRHDLVPNLVETVKGYATHERETFQKVTEARADAMKAQGPAQAGAAEGRLSAVLGDLRRIYNSNVQTYNTKIQVFPNSIVAGRRHFEAKEFFEITDAADREPVQVSFN